MAKTARDPRWAEAIARERPELVAPTGGEVVDLKWRRSLQRDAVHLGDDESGAVGIDLRRLMEGRLLVQGASGAGKSWTLRRILEQSAGAVQQIVIDPEGEFDSFAEEYGYVTLDAALVDGAAIAVAARRAREHRLSVRFDLSQVDRETQMIAVASLFIALVDAPREHWHPAMVVVDEAHLFAPFGGQSDAPSSVRKAAIQSLVDLMSRGRKRGLAGILATQRLARLSKSVASEVLNFLIGLNTLDLDIRRAADTIGWDTRRAARSLPELSPGEFWAVGPAFVESPLKLKVGPVQTEHRGAAPALSDVDLVAPDAARGLIDLDGLIRQSTDDALVRDERSYTPGLRAVREAIRDRGFAPAGIIFEALQPLYPDGAAIVGMAGTLGITEREFNCGVSFLDDCGAVEFMGEGEGRTVRIARSMQP